MTNTTPIRNSTDIYLVTQSFEADSQTTYVTFVEDVSPPIGQLDLNTGFDRTPRELSTDSLVYERPYNDPGGTDVSWAVSGTDRSDHVETSTADTTHPNLASTADTTHPNLASTHLVSVQNLPLWHGDNDSVFLPGLQAFSQHDSSILTWQPNASSSDLVWGSRLFPDRNNINETTTWTTLQLQHSSGCHEIDTWFPLSLKVSILVLASVIGAIGNVLVIRNVVKERFLHRPPFYFLLSLSVTDLSRAVFCLPVVISTVLHGSQWRHGESACKLFAFATSFFVFSSTLSLLAIAIDRHVSIVYSKTYRRRSLGLANLIVAVIIWIIAFSVSFPPVVGVGNYVFIPEEAQCTYQHKHYTYNDSVSSVLIFIAILFLTYFLYFRIFRFLRAHRRMRPLQHTPALSSNWAFIGPGANGQAFINWLNGFGGQVPTRQGGQRAVQRLNFGRVVNLSTAKNEHLTRQFLVLSLVFGVTWLPYVVLSVWRIFFEASLIPRSYATVSAWLGYGQLAICPLVYFLSRGGRNKISRPSYPLTEKREFLLENKIGK